jgi:predicted dehydrogenase
LDTPVIKSGRTWRFNPELSGKGQLTDSGSHAMAQLFWLTGFNPSKVAAFSDFMDKEVDINTAFSVKFKEGALGSFAVLGVDATGGMRESMVLWADKGVMRISLTEGSYVQYRGEKEHSEIPVVEPAVKSPAEDLIKVITESKKPETPFSVVEKIALLSDKIYESFEEGKIAEI